MSLTNPLVLRLSRVAASSYVRAVATLSTGQFLAALLPLLAAPILGRLYRPADYGILATYMAIANVLASMSTLQLQQAIIAERTDRRAVELVTVCQRAGLFVALIAAAVAAVLILRMGQTRNFAQARWWMVGLPFSTWAAAATAGITALANRRGKYGFMARAQVIAVIATVSTSIAFGLMSWGPAGLLSSYFIGQVIALAYQLWLYRRLVPVVPHLSEGRTWMLVRRHRRFAIYTLPSELMGTVQLQFPVFVLSSVGAVALLGAFTRARALLAMPLTLLGSAIGQVFRQRASEQFRQTGSCQRIYEQTFWVLLSIGFLPTIGLMLFAPDIFRIVLGPNWTEAGRVARILAPVLLLQLVCSPISTVFYFLHYQRDEFILGIVTFVLLVVSVLAAAWLTSDRMLIFYAYAAANCVTYLVYSARGWMIASGKVPHRR